jgi:chemotaxis signal transduction protein
MDNNDIIDIINIKNSENEEDSAEKEKKIIKFIVFNIGESIYAIEANAIREIVLDISIFHVPFVPTYVRGFINRHGEPYTVIDLMILFEQRKLDSSTFLVLSDDDNPAAFLISEVVEIMKIPEDHVHYITSETFQQEFITGSVSAQEKKEILILDYKEIFKRLEADIEP